MSPIAVAFKRAKIPPKEGEKRSITISYTVVLQNNHAFPDVLFLQSHQNLPFFHPELPRQLAARDQRTGGILGPSGAITDGGAITQGLITWRTIFKGGWTTNTASLAVEPWRCDVNGWFC